MAESNKRKMFDDDEDYNAKPIDDTPYGYSNPYGTNEEKKSKYNEEESKGATIDFGDVTLPSKAYTPTLLEDENPDFTVSDPIMQGGHIVYSVRGIDKQGQWEGKRRYNEFHVLHEVLAKRWPGVFIPKVPPKKAIGNKDQKFINERRYYLERFLKKISKNDFLLNSEEFLIFSRPNGDIEKILDRLPALPASSLLDRLRNSTGIIETKYDLTDKERMHNLLVEFQYFSKKTMGIMKTLKKSLETFRVAKQATISNHNVFQTLIMKYEDLNLKQYVEGRDDKLVFANPNNTQVKDQLSNLIESQKNPFEDMYHWCKGEMNDLQSLTRAVESVETIEKKRKKAEAKKKDTQYDLEHVNAGKKSVRTLFKNAGDTGGMVSSIETIEKDIENLQCLVELMNIYLGEKVIPVFKKEKLSVYVKLMQQFNVMEINNAHQVASFWSTVLSNPEVKNANQSK